MIHRHLIHRIQTKLFLKDIGLYAACISFFILLSSIPLSLLFISVITSIPTSSFMRNIISSLIPIQLLHTIQFFLEYISNAGSFAILSVSGLVALWSASRSIVYVREGINSVFSGFRSQKYIQKRIAAVLSLALILFVGFGVLFIIIIGECLLQIAEVSQFLWLRILCSLLLLTFSLAAVYRILMQFRLTAHLYILCGAFVSGLWILLSISFSIYVNFFTKTHLVYGVFGSAALAFFWLYLSIYILLLGGRIGYACFRNNCSFMQTIQSIFSSER